MSCLGNSVPITVQAKVPIIIKDLYHLRHLHYALFSPSFTDFIVTMSHSEHLFWKSQFKWTFRRLKVSSGLQLHCDTSQVPWFLSLPWMKPITLELLESFEVLLNIWKNRSVSLESQPFLTHSPDHVGTMQWAKEVIYPVACSASLMRSYRFGIKTC